MRRLVTFVASIIIFFIFEIESTSSVEITPKHVVTSPYQDAVLECDVIKIAKGAAITISWYHGNDTQLTDSTKYKITQDNHVGTLIVSTVARADCGEYKCRIDDGTEQTVHLFVSPYVHVWKPSTRIIEGSSLDLVCDAWGHEEPKISWMKNSVELQTTGVQLLPNDHGIANGRLLLENVHPSDGANYTCTAANSNGTFSRSTTVRVQYKLAWLVPFLILVGEVLFIFIIIGTSELVARKRNERLVASTHAPGSNRPTISSTPTPRTSFPSNQRNRSLSQQSRQTSTDEPT